MPTMVGNPELSNDDGQVALALWANVLVCFDKNDKEDTA
jgi:hypothetical protein